MPRRTHASLELPLPAWDPGAVAPQTLPGGVRDQDGRDLDALRLRLRLQVAFALQNSGSSSASPPEMIECLECDKMRTLNETVLVAWSVDTGSCYDRPVVLHACHVRGHVRGHAPSTPPPTTKAKILRYTGSYMQRGHPKNAWHNLGCNTAKVNA